MTYLTEDELDERLRAATAAAAQRRSERLRLRAAFAATRGVGLQQRHATKLAHLDRELSDPPDPIPPHEPRPGSGLRPTADLAGRGAHWVGPGPLSCGSDGRAYDGPGHECGPVYVSESVRTDKRPHSRRHGD
jgi:hypothetical protein